jgi:hypothetical protein
MTYPLHTAAVAMMARKSQASMTPYAGIQVCVVKVVVVEYIRRGPVPTAVTESTRTVRDHRYTHTHACGSHTEPNDET